MKKNIYFIVIGLSPKAGGLTKAIFERANFLVNFYNVTILTYQFQPDFYEVVDILYNSNKIDSRVNFLNFYIDQHEVESKFFRESFLNSNELESRTISKILDNTIIFSNNVYRKFDEFGCYRFYVKKFNKSLIVMDVMDVSDFNTLSRRYFFIKNRLFSLEIHSKESKNQVVIFNKNLPKINFFCEKGDISERCFTIQGIESKDSKKKILIKEWVSSYVNDDDIVFLDNYFKDTSSYVDGITCKKIAFVHSNHRNSKDVEYLLKHTNFSKYVCLTSTQLKELMLEYTELKNKLNYLPHFYHEKNNSRVRSSTIVTVSRLFLKDKPILLGIKAFKVIADKFPNIDYFIYGVGPDKSVIQLEIDKMKLTNRVFLKGYTNNSTKVFSDSILSLSLSYAEGFGLSNLESLSMSCPVISSDIDYGPKEMIVNGVNGYLVNNSDVNMISESIGKILENPSYYQNNCFELLKEFEYRNWCSRMIDLVEN